MSRNALSRWLAPLALATVILAAPAAAQADDSIGIDINPGNVPTTAKGHSGQSCDGVPKDKDADQDG